MVVKYDHVHHRGPYGMLNNVDLYLTGSSAETKSGTEMNMVVFDVRQF